MNAIKLYRRRRDSARQFPRSAQVFYAGSSVWVSRLLNCLAALLGHFICMWYPAIAGIFTAIIGGVFTPLISNSELTIKGPAAGLIVIAIGCVQDFGGDGIFGGWSAADQNAYQLALGVGIVAAVLQIFLGLFRAELWGSFSPLRLCMACLRQSA